MLQLKARITKLRQQKYDEEKQILEGWNKLNKKDDYSVSAVQMRIMDDYRIILSGVERHKDICPCILDFLRDNRAKTLYVMHQKGVYIDDNGVLLIKEDKSEPPLQGEDIFLHNIGRLFKWVSEFSFGGVLEDEKKDNDIKYKRLTIWYVQELIQLTDPEKKDAELQKMAKEIAAIPIGKMHHLAQAFEEVSCHFSADKVKDACTILLKVFWKKYQDLESVTLPKKRRLMCDQTREKEK